MAFTRTWDHTTPEGTEQANTIDNHMRNLRLDLEERLKREISWEADEDDGLLKEGTGKIASGVAADIPAADAKSKGRLYFETDTGLLKRDIGGDAPAWETIAKSDPLMAGDKLIVKLEGSNIQDQDNVHIECGRNRSSGYQTFGTAFTSAITYSVVATGVETGPSGNADISDKSASKFYLGADGKCDWIAIGY